MKLIDAETFKELWKDCKIEGSLDALIDARPIVDAIPVEWIENYIAEFRNKIEDDEKAGVGVYISYKDELKGIETMLQFWRKENE